MLALATAMLLTAACGASAPPSSLGPQVSPASPATHPAQTPIPTLQVDCGYGLAPADCMTRQTAALEVVAASGHVATHLWLSSGVLCPFVDNCLFNPNANFPAPFLPGETPAPDGTMSMASGSAEIAFADTDQHAGINFFTVGTKVVASLIGYRVPDRAWCSGECAGASDTSGAFTLELTMPHLDWNVGEPIVASSAVLLVQSSVPVKVSGATDLIVFGYAEVGGKRSFGPASDLACATTTLDPATPNNVPIGKSGGWDPNNPADAWIVQFNNADGIRLPAGTWDVTAEAQFTEGSTCSATPHDLRATLRVVVSP
jgi:hypothetical protein